MYNRSVRSRPREHGKATFRPLRVVRIHAVRTSPPMENTPNQQVQNKRHFSAGTNPHYQF